MSKPGINGKNGLPILIILEGPDKSGKSTIYQALRRATNYQPFVIDRFIGSNFAYDRVFDRDNREEEYLELEKQLATIFDILVVFLDTSIDTLLARDPSPQECRDITAVAIPYQIYLEQTTLMGRCYDTGKVGVEEIVEDLVRIIKQKEEEV